MLNSKHTESQVLALSVQKKYKHCFTVLEKQLNEQHIDTRGWTRNSKGEIVASPPNRRIYLDGTNQAKNYDEYLKRVSSGEREYAYLERCRDRFEQERPSSFFPTDWR